eukprot:7630494-Pyramimonas_sp.AAC.1
MATKTKQRWRHRKNEGAGCNEDVVDRLTKLSAPQFIRAQVIGAPPGARYLGGRRDGSEGAFARDERGGP